MDKPSLGSRLRERRLQLGLTLEDVAKASGMAVGTLSDLEQGRQKGSKRLHHIAKALDLNVTYLETGEGPELLEVKEPSPAMPPNSWPGFWPSSEGAQLGAEWDKIKDESVKRFIFNVVFGHVSAQARGETPPPMPAPPQTPSVSIKTSPKGHRSRKEAPPKRPS